MHGIQIAMRFMFAIQEQSGCPQQKVTLGIGEEEQLVSTLLCALDKRNMCMCKASVP